MPDHGHPLIEKGALHEALESVKRYRKIVSVDFDGVIHSYSSGWKGAENIPDGPVPGAIGWLTEMCSQDEFKVCIYSSRSSSSAGIRAMQEWLLRHGMRADVLACIDFPSTKPPAHITIDDRGFAFDGVFPDADYINGFKPWYKR